MYRRCFLFVSYIAQTLNLVGAGNQRAFFRCCLTALKFIGLFHLSSFGRQGKCKFGASCTFSHEPQGRIPVCPFFQQRGSCRYGNSCKFLHHIPTAGVAESGAREQEESVGELRSGGSRRTIARAGVASSAPNQTSASSSDSGECCGICLENIPASGKRFGLLNCDHAYCLGEYSFGTLRCCLFFKR